MASRRSLVIEEGSKLTLTTTTVERHSTLDVLQGFLGVGDQPRSAPEVSTETVLTITK